MKIGLYNLEPKYKNLALEKVRKYYLNRGYEVEDYFALNYYDEVWCSSIFGYTPKDTVPPTAKCGGTGFDLVTKLPPEMDEIKPRLNFGFTTRGCPNKCKFCVVPEKEGGIVATGDILSLWDGYGLDITILDNNATALLDHFEMNCNQAKNNNLRIDWNQGLDHRRLTQGVLDIIKQIRHKELRFAFDNVKYINSVETAINLLQRNGIKRCLWYVLVGFDSTIKEDLQRLNYLRDRGQTAFVQRYNRSMDKRLIVLSRWANQHHLFNGMTWQQFLRHPDSIRRKSNLLFT